MPPGDAWLPHTSACPFFSVISKSWSRAWGILDAQNMLVKGTFTAWGSGTAKLPVHWPSDHRSCPPISCDLAEHPVFCRQLGTSLQSPPQPRTFTAFFNSQTGEQKQRGQIPSPRSLAVCLLGV